jgi:pSer/pThr/pTyr-binding forkhead associated (FHA) protein|tara:strand:- start:349 stop:489 length:141 start_codon:yes stop_codon:yes gene_type:complete
VGGNLVVKDLGSANGTFVNNKKVKEAQPKTGDLLQFEKVAFIIKGP